MNNGHNNDLERRMERVERIVAALADVQDDVHQELRTLAKSQVLMSETLTLMSETLTKHIANAEERDRETTDKLNALIAIVDQHIRDHRTSPSS